MNELYNKIDHLKNELNGLDLLKNIEAIEIKIKDNDLLYQKIKNDNTVVSSDNDIIEYKKLENELNFLILSMNQRLKTLTTVKGCGKK